MTTNLKKRIMKRVFRFWLLRSVVPILIGELIVIALAVYLFANLIFVGQVIDNALNAALGNPWKLVVYLWNAFLGTRLEVQVIIIALLAAAALTLRDLNRGLISYILMKREQSMSG